MKRTKSMVYTPSIEARELTLYAINDGRLYDYWMVPIVRNLARKYSKGTFDADRAIDAFNGGVRRMELREELGRSKP